MARPGEPAGAAGTVPGQVILLNGASSSGKTSIAAELQEVLDRPWFHLPVDAFNSMRARRQTAALDQRALAAVLARTRAGFHRARPVPRPGRRPAGPGAPAGRLRPGVRHHHRQRP